MNVAETGFAIAARRLLPLLFVSYIVAFLDRVNIGFAKLQMASALGFSDAVYGFGAGIFFLGYFLFEVPSNLALEKFGARRWITRIMFTWAIISGAFAFVDRIPWGPLPALFGVAPLEFGFYALRFLLGVAEAGFFPGIILYLTYWFPAAKRARTVALFMTAVAAANVIGAPVSGAIMQYADGMGGWSGWRWLFVLEAIPSMIAGIGIWCLLPDRPAQASWLTPEQRHAITAQLAQEDTAAHGIAHSTARVAATGAAQRPRVGAGARVSGRHVLAVWRELLDADHRAGAGHRQDGVPGDRTAQHDPVGHRRRRHGVGRRALRPHRRAASACGGRVARGGGRAGRAGARRCARGAGADRALLRDRRRVVVFRHVLVVAHRLPPANRRRGRYRLDQRGRESRWPFRTGHYRPHSNGHRQRELRVSFPRGAGSGRGPAHTVRYRCT